MYSSIGNLTPSFYSIIINTMENQDNILDEEVSASVNDETWDNDSGEDDNNDTSAKKSNQSNFKALYKSNKEKEALLAQKEQELKEAREELEQWRELNPETVEDLKANNDISSVKEEIFVLKNKEAEPHIAKIREAQTKYNMDIDTAWKFVKMDIPQESKSSQDFSVGKTAVTKNTDFTKISPEDALELSKEDQSKWRKANGWE